MGEESNQVMNIRSQTKRFRTATVRAKILNTERLNHIGLDMSEVRSKDLVNFRYCKGTYPIDLSQSFYDSSASYNQPECSQIQNQDYDSSMLLCNSKRSNVCKNPQLLQRSEDRFRNPADLPTLVSLTVRNQKPSLTEENARETNQHFLAKQSTKKFVSRFFNFQMEQTSNSDMNLKEKSEQPGNFTKNSFRIYDSTKKSNKDLNDIQTKNKVSQSKSNGWLYFVECPEENTVKKITNKKEILPVQRFQKCNICGNSFGTAGFKIHQPRCSQVRLLPKSLFK